MANIDDSGQTAKRPTGERRFDIESAACYGNRHESDISKASGPPRSCVEGNNHLLGSNGSPEETSLPTVREIKTNLQTGYRRALLPT